MVSSLFNTYNLMSHSDINMPAMQSATMQVAHSLLLATLKSWEWAWGRGYNIIKIASEHLLHLELCRARIPCTLYDIAFVVYHIATDGIATAFMILKYFELEHAQSKPLNHGMIMHYLCVGVVDRRGQSNSTFVAFVVFIKPIGSKDS